MRIDDKSVEIAMEPVGPSSTPPLDPGEVSDPEHASIIRQTRTRRLFSTAQLFAFTLVFQGTWSSVAGNMYFAILNGGPRGWLIGYFICAVGALLQTASLAEMASLQPVAGAQYYWTYSFAPKSQKMFLTWLQGWVCWFGYVAGLASIVNYLKVNITGLMSLGNPEYVPTGWQSTLLYLAILAVITIINLYIFWIVPWFELAAGIINTLLFFATLIILWVVAPRNSMDIFSLKSDASYTGWDDFTSFNVGMLSSVFLFLSFESSVHMGEETRNPKVAVPKSMWWAVFTNVLMGVIMMFTWGIAMPAPDEILMSVAPVASILLYATGSSTTAMAILSLLMISAFGSLLGTFSSTARLSWAWARDGGLPKYFAIVDGRTRVPERAVWGTAFLVTLLGLLNLNDDAFIAMGAFTSIAVLAGFVSYAIVLACIIYSRYTTPGGIELGEWNIGRLGMPVNIAAFVYTCYQIIWLPFPMVLPVTAINMNYTGPVFGVVLIGSISWWFLWAKNKWSGPNLKVVEIVLKNDEASAKM